MKKFALFISFCLFSGTGFADEFADRSYCLKAGNAYANALQHFCSGRRAGEVSNAIAIAYNIDDNTLNIVVSAALNDSKSGHCSGSQDSDSRHFYELCMKTLRK